MSPAFPVGAAVRSPDAVEEASSFEFAETPDVAATAPAPTLRKSRRVVFIFTPPIPSRGGPGPARRVRIRNRRSIQESRPLFVFGTADLYRACARTLGTAPL